jgi:hypothetical protein
MKKGNWKRMGNKTIRTLRSSEFNRANKNNNYMEYEKTSNIIKRIKIGIFNFNKFGQIF